MTTKIVPSGVSTRIVTQKRVIVVKQAVVGQRGLQGPPGSDAGELDSVDFSYGDATPLLITTVAAGTRVSHVRLDVHTAFNGSGPQLTVGSMGGPGELIAADDNSPSLVGAFETNPNRLYASETPIYLFITPGTGTTVGSGRVVLKD